VCVYKRLFMKDVGPHLLVANIQAPPPPLQGVQERIGCPRQLPGQNCFSFNVWFSRHRNVF
jgi:hypothetical protein